MALQSAGSMSIDKPASTPPLGSESLSAPSLIWTHLWYNTLFRPSWIMTLDNLAALSGSQWFTRSLLRATSAGILIYRLHVHKSTESRLPILRIRRRFPELIEPRLITKFVVRKVIESKNPISTNSGMNCYQTAFVYLSNTAVDNWK